jgi:uncharacterized protein
MTNLETVQELYRAFREQDDAALFRICTPDLEWIQNEGFPQGATYHGAVAVVEGVFKSNHARWEKFSFQIDQYLDAGDSIIVTGAYVGHNRQSQQPLHAVAAHIYDLIDGKVCRFRMFADTKTIWDSLEQR